MLVSRAKFEGFLTGYGLILAFALVTAALVLVHGGSVLNYAFPAAGTILAGILISARRSVYVAFVWWIWLFTPLVRRLVDFQTGYHNISPVMVTPLLVTGFALLTIASRPWIILQRNMAPFLMILLAFLLALVVGMINNGALPALYDFVGWLLPVAFAVFLMMFPDDFGEMQSAIIFAAILGLIFIAGYGIYQFYHIPPWDAYWIHASGFDTAGLAEDQQVRLFGTLNSPGPYAEALMACLVFVAVAKGPLRIGAAILGFPAFGLSLVRSAWGGFVLAMLFFVWRVGGKTRVRILVIGAIVATAVVPLVTVGSVGATLASRFSTLNNIQQDDSFQARVGLYESTMLEAFEQPVGTGFGKFGLAAKLATGQTADFDSGILQVAYQFGWVGGALFVWAIGTFTGRVLSATRLTKDRVAIAGGGLYFAILSQNIFVGSFSGVTGIALWTGLALAINPVGETLPSGEIIEEQRPGRIVSLA